MLKLSIIIPVYNAAPYLRECLDSLLSQRLRELEILCVDDGSTDDSPAILAEYAARDARIRLLHQQNLGAGAARNAGIEAAAGEYLFFMDADDSVTEDGLARVCALADAKRADLVRCRAHDYNQQTGKLSDGPHNALLLIPKTLFGKPLRFRRAYPLFPRMCAAPWGGIVRRELVLDARLRFNTLRCVNDRSFFWDSVVAARRIVLADVFVLRYRTHLSTSLIGSRLRCFDCHFRSYALVEKTLAPFPRRVRRRVLGGEMHDIANWLETARGTELEASIAASCRDFVRGMDKSPWHGDVRRTRWYERMRWALEPNADEKEKKA